MHCGKRIAVIPAGERWKADGSLRPAVEDWIGAGAIISHLQGTRSPEAQTAVAAYREAMGDLLTVLRECSSGKELAAMGDENDIILSAVEDADTVAPRLVNGAYCRAESDCGTYNGRMPYLAPAPR